MLGFGKKSNFRSIPYGMFDNASFGLAAKNAKILERVYHKGQRSAWDGKEVLQSLIETHGTPHLPPKEAKALGRVFGLIMWGELAAWRISAELADEIEPLEAKMAATSRALDASEAREKALLALEAGSAQDARHWFAYALERGGAEWEGAAQARQDLALLSGVLSSGSGHIGGRGAVTR